MTVKQLESAIAQLRPTELAELAAWFDEFRAKAWDKQIQCDLEAGRLDAVIRQAEQEFEAGRCRPL
jgi:hypothetical protein